MTSLPELIQQPRRQLLATATERGVDLRPHLQQDELVQAIASHMMANGETVTTDGVLAILPEGFGFVRMVPLNFRSTAVDAYVSANQVRSLNLHSGHRIRGEIRAPRGTERTFALVHVDLVQDTPPEQLMDVTGFASRTPVAATRPLALAPNKTPTPKPGKSKVKAKAPSETNESSNTSVMLHALQTLSPLCFGQRMLLHATPAWPRARFLATLANSIEAQHPEADITVCLLDQRPEDIVTAQALAGSRTCVVSTAFATPPEHQVTVAELAWHRCLRQVEQGHDVILLVDSMTALTRARSRSSVASGSWIQPGLDAKAILLAKEVLASTKQCEEGGSLTVIASVTTDAADTIDAAIEREFAALTNSDVVIDADAEGLDGLCFDLVETRTRAEDNPSHGSPCQQQAAKLRGELAALPYGERAAGWLAAAADLDA
tara:strand:+ start:18741 stop:20039 length:1299 start_codon:yes stop_codon:yes gene_type:complete